MKDYLKYLKGDPVIWIITILLMAFSLVTVYSFVPILVKIEGGSPLQYLLKHFFYVVIAFFIMFLIHRADSKYISQLSKFSYYMAVLILLFTLFFGSQVNDAGRWIKIPFIGLTFQSSDFAKLALILYLSRLLVKKKEKLNSWREGVFPVVLPIIVICFLILKDNFSTAAMLFMLCLAMLFIGRMPYGKLFTMLGFGFVLVFLIICIHKAAPELNILPRYDTWVSRYNSKMDESSADILKNAQSNNAKLAIHNGSFLGQGVGDGKLKEYIPEAYADFYYSSFVEEFGSISAIVLILIYLILLFRIIRIALKTDDLFQTYVCMGIGIHLLTQVSINMLVCTGIFPVTGQNMPFLAMGGSALIMACASIGIVQSFAFNLQKRKLMQSETTFQTISGG
ncbi:MAG: FtsW/RodA/SpoVE family cell cycle protein [Bacteroidetes bacterium]|nr:FtsW/RodA/SpoVE family cell cycle protein [Bacteroidota bacterium]